MSLWLKIGGVYVLLRYGRYDIGSVNRNGIKEGLKFGLFCVSFDCLKTGN